MVNIMKEIKLSPWKAVATLPYQADFSQHIQQGVLLPNLTDWIDASVPGSIYKDLHRAGVIEDPYFGENSLACEWVAGRWWIYRTTFTVTAEDCQDTLRLCFHGIDYSAQIFLNGKKLGHHEGMYLPFEAIVNDQVKPDEENVLVCVLEHAPLADPQPGYTSKTRYLKARYNYKWDFAVRLVNLGLYDEVTLTRHNTAHIAHSFVRPMKKENSWELDISLELDVYRDSSAEIHFSLQHPTRKEEKWEIREEIALKKGFQTWRTTLPVESPELWWPNGYGAQTLYDFQLDVSADGCISDEVSHKIGFRTLEFRHADGREDALTYNAVINGKRVFLKGTNLVPLCCMTGSVTEEHLRRTLQAAKEAYVNYFRIWGGGHLESRRFYELCDEYGLMVLQEFTMSSSGCDDVPSRNPEFLELLRKAAVYNIKWMRNHVSLIAMDGGNELTDERYMDSDDHEGHPADFNDPTLAMLKGLVNSHAPDILMLPSSGSGPNALLKVGDLGNNHDVHGPWGYVGPYDHYNFYNQSDCIVHGEFGCGGISSLESIQKFMEEKDQHLCTSNENPVWRHHSGGWDTYSMREMQMFGDLRQIGFAEYIKVNQFIQAESLRYSLEANRRRQWACVGEMTWQFNEPWPNIQCSNLLEYYGGKKLALYFMQEAYSPVLASLKYHKLFYTAGETFQAEIHLINDYPDADFQIACEVVTESGEALFSCTETGRAAEDLSFKVRDLSVILPEGLTGSFSVRLKTTCGEFSSEKEYLMLIADQDIPVSLTETEELAIQTFSKKRKMDPSITKRADWRSAAAFVNRMDQKYRK